MGRRTAFACIMICGDVRRRMVLVLLMLLILFSVDRTGPVSVVTHHAHHLQQLAWRCECVV